jgi:hypothetical protein
MHSHSPTNAKYEIRLQGHLGPEWSEWFDGFQIATSEGGQAVLTGTVTDQAALHGLLSRIRDIGLPIIAIRRLDP